MSQSLRSISRTRQTVVLAVMCLAVILVMASVSSLNVAIPFIGGDLEADQSQLQWIVNAYALILAAFLLPAGALGDRLSRKAMLVVGLVVIVGGSLWSATAGSPIELILARGLSGLGAALVFPCTLSTLTAVMPAEWRSRAVALWAACSAVGGIVGIIGAGVLLERWSWPSVFWATGLLAAICLVLAVAVVPDTRDPEAANLDPLGSVLSILGVGGIVLGITEAPARGWSDGLVLVGMIGGGAALVAFALWETRTRRPLLDVRLFGNPHFGSGSLAIFLLFFATFGAFFMCVQYVAYVFGYGPLDSGLALLPIGVALLPAALLGPAVTRRIGLFAVEAVGMLVTAAGLVGLARLDVDSSFAAFAAPLIVFGFGLGLCMAPATEAILAALPAAKQGVASAVNDTARELGGALGIAAIGSVFNSGYRSAVDSVTGLSSDLMAAVRDSPATGLAIGGSSPDVVMAVRESFVHGYRIALIVAAGVVAGGAAAVIAVGIRGRSSELGRHAPDPPAPQEAEWDRIDAMTDGMRRAEASLAALRLMVRDQTRTRECLDERERRVEAARHQAVDVIDGTVRALEQLASGLRDDEHA